MCSYFCSLLMMRCLALTFLFTLSPYKTHTHTQVKNWTKFENLPDFPPYFFISRHIFDVVVEALLFLKSRKINCYLKKQQVPIASIHSRWTPAGMLPGFGAPARFCRISCIFQLKKFPWKFSIQWYLRLHVLQMFLVEHGRLGRRRPIALNNTFKPRAIEH